MPSTVEFRGFPAWVSHRSGFICEEGDDLRSQNLKFFGHNKFLLFGEVRTAQDMLGSIASKESE